MLARRASGANDGGGAGLALPSFAEGCLLAGTPGAGSYFPQPWSGGARLDDIAGPGPWLIQPEGSAADAPVTTLSLDEPRLAPFATDLRRWLAAHGGQAVLVRADRYVFGTGAPAALCDAWAKALAG